MSKYSKLIISVLGTIIVVVQTVFSIDLAGQGITAEAIMAILVPVLSSFGVWALPNVDDASALAQAKLEVVQAELNKLKGSGP